MVEQMPQGQMPQGQMQGQGQAQGDDMSTLPTDILVSMRVIGQAFQEGGAPQSALEKLGQAITLYEQALQEVSGGGMPQEGQMQQRQGAQPVAQNPEGMPMGPQGI